MAGSEIIIGTRISPSSEQVRAQEQYLCADGLYGKWCGLARETLEFGISPVALTVYCQNFADSTQHTGVIQCCGSPRPARGPSKWGRRHDTRGTRRDCHVIGLFQPSCLTDTALLYLYNNVIPSRGEKRGWETIHIMKRLVETVFLKSSRPPWIRV